MTEDEMVGWHHQLDGHEFEQAPGVGDGQGKPGVLQSKSWTLLINSTTATLILTYFLHYSFCNMF